MLKENLMIHKFRLQGIDHTPLILSFSILKVIFFLIVQLMMEQKFLDELITPIFHLIRMKYQQMNEVNMK